MNKCFKTLIALTVAYTPCAVYSEEKPSHTLKIESTITGDNEQPAVSYFVPWKDVGTPDKLQWQLDEKYDDTLSKADRDIMLRSARIYEQMNIEQK